MSRDDLMQLFLREMRKRLPRISRATYSVATIEKHAIGAFTIVSRWPATNGQPEGEYRIFFDRQRVLGRTESLPIIQQRLTKKLCRFHDDIISEILHARGLK